MLRTEDEARECWCPFARDCTGEDNGVAMAMATFNRPFGDNTTASATCTCITTRCMAWRWGKDENGEPAYKRMPLGGGNFENAPQGYCGLAGRPEE